MTARRESDKKVRLLTKHELNSLRTDMVRSSRLMKLELLKRRIKNDS